MRQSVIVLALAAASALSVSMSGCRNHSQDLLFVYSGDCQGYIEPCG